MSFIDSSTRQSGLSASAPLPDDEERDGAPDGEELEDDETQQREPKKRAAPAGSLKAQLVENIEDINLARYLPDDELDRIGMQCIRDFDLDLTSRAGWEDKAVAAMKFAVQDAVPKTSPWSGASNVIFPMIARAAIDFGSRTYPAIVQGRNVVKGVVWGDDNGTPVTKDSDPEGAPRLSTGALLGSAAAAPQAAAAAPQPPEAQAQAQAPGRGEAPGPQPSQPVQPVWLIAPGEKQKRADRVGEHMSWQLLEEMPEWEPQTDLGLHQMPVCGGFVRKSYHDPMLGRNRSLLVSLMNLVWNYHAPSFEVAPRHSEKLLVYPHHITEYERFEDDSDDETGGMWLRHEYGPGGAGEGMRFNYDDAVQSGDQADEDAPHFFIEQHRRLDLDEDGYPEPYIVTVHHRSAKVVRIVARYDEDGIDASDDGDTIRRIEPADEYTLYPFLPNIDGGSYPMGFGHLLKPLNHAINTSLNQMFDAATLQNAGGGFISDQLGMPSGQTLFQVGKFVRVNAKGGSIRDAIYQPDFKGPSSVLFQLLGLLIGECKELASLNSVLQGDAQIANAPPTTILALIEQGLKVYTAIYKRVWRAEKAELAKLSRLNRLNMRDTERYMAGDVAREVTKEDYRLGGGVTPIADPTMTTDMQKLARAEILMGMKGDPLINQVEIRKRLFVAANMDRIDSLFVQPDTTAIQMAMQQEQAKLGMLRAQELDHQTHAYLNMALARKNASAGEEAQLERQLTFMRLRIEALNAQTKAAAVDHKYHDTAVGAASDEADRAHELALARTQAQGDGDAFPLATAEPPSGPAVSKPTPGGPPSDLSAAPAPLPAALQTPQG